MRQLTHPCTAPRDHPRQLSSTTTGKRRDISSTVHCATTSSSVQLSNKSLGNRSKPKKVPKRAQARPLKAKRRGHLPTPPALPPFPSRCASTATNSCAGNSLSPHQPLLWLSSHVRVCRGRRLVFRSGRGGGVVCDSLKSNHALEPRAVDRQVGVAQLLLLHEWAQRAAVPVDARIFLEVCPIVESADVQR